MQKIALLIAVLSMGAGCASQGTGMASASGSSSSRADRYPWMNSQSDLTSESLQRDSSGSVIVQTPSTSAQFDPAMSSTGSLSANADMDMDRDVDLSLDADRSVDSNLDISASGGPASVESGSSISSDVQSHSIQAESNIDRQPADDLHSGSATWNKDRHDRQANFEGAVATDDVDEASGRPAGSESSASSSLQAGDSEVQVDANVGNAANADIETSTSADVDIDTSTPRVEVDTHVSEPIVTRSHQHDIKADSSIRGGSDRARHIDLRHMDSETPRNYSEEREIKADSSIRGGSDRVRGVQLREMDTESPRTWNKNRIKADSSVRGALAQARGTDRLWMSSNRPADVPTGRVTSNEPDFLHKMNPASGSPAPTHSGRAEAFTPGITAGSSAAVSSSGLADQVKKSLVRENSGTGGMLSRDIARNIKVQENNGTIILSGSVPNERTSRLIEIRAAEVRGVKKVENQMTINRDSLPAERNVDVQIDSQQR